jgi:hypothetical protein
MTAYSGLTGEPALADVQREYPTWRCRRDISGLYYACPASAEPGHQAIVKGEDPLDLRDQIRRAVSQQDHRGGREC